MSGDRIHHLLLPLITVAIMMVILMTDIITPEDITDMVGTPEEVGIGTTIPMDVIKTGEIIAAQTVHVGVADVASRLYPERETPFPRSPSGFP